MKVVNAVWEKRNLGVDCNEITVEAKDMLPEIERDIVGYETEYTVVKVLAGRANVLLFLQQSGFVFIETLTICYHRGDAFGLNRVQQRIIEQVRYAEMQNIDVNFMFKQISKGLFTTDRVSLDPHFSVEQANQRYIYWLQDELHNGAKAYKLSFKGKDIGFFTLKRKTDIEYTAFLSAVYPDYFMSGLGLCPHYFEVTEGIALGAKHVMTSYSSNNRGATAIHLSMGHVLHRQYHVLIKHK
jgi:hypothetical protein